MSNIKAVLSPSGTHLIFFCILCMFFTSGTKVPQTALLGRLPKNFSLQKYRTRRTYDNYKATLISTPIFQIILKAMYRQKKNLCTTKCFQNIVLSYIKRSSIPSYLKKAAIGNACSCVCFVKSFDMNKRIFEKL